MDSVGRTYTKHAFEQQKPNNTRPTENVMTDGKNYRPRDDGRGYSRARVLTFYGTRARAREPPRQQERVAVRIFGFPSSRLALVAAVAAAAAATVVGRATRPGRRCGAIYRDGGARLAPLRRRTRSPSALVRALVRRPVVFFFFNYFFFENKLKTRPSTRVSRENFRSPSKPNHTMRFLASCAVLAVLPFCMQAAVVSGGQNYVEDSQRAGRSDESSSGSGNWAVIARAAEQCARDVDPAACVAVKAAAALERAARMGNMQLVPGVTLARNDGLVRDSRALPTEEELRGHLSSDSTGADGPSKAAAVLANSAIQFLQSRSLRFDFPHTDPEQLSRAIEEGQ